MKHVDVLIIGAGPSGTVAASFLRNQGYEVLIVERLKFPRLVVGESLLPLSMGHFEEVGLLPALEAMDFEVKAGAKFFHPDGTFHLSFKENHTPGWTWTWQVPREDFDKTLADATERKGVEINYETTVSDLRFLKDNVEADITGADGTKQTVTCRFVIDSSGNGGVLAQMLKIPTHTADTGRMAVFTHVDDTTRDQFDSPMQISFDILERDLWFWVIPFSNGITSIGMVGNKDYFKEFGTMPDEQALRNMIPRSARFSDRFGKMPFRFSPNVIKDYTRATERFIGDRFVLTGNCAEFLDPVFSSGVAFATESGLKAAKLVHRQLQGENVDWQRDYVDHMEEGIAVFRSYVREWYTGNLQKIFWHRNINMRFKKMLTSVLAGYVWDRENPFVNRHDHIIQTLARVVELEQESELEGLI
ncbi:MAG: tryptophan 7-halogenase [Flavobacteriales bacterium]|nr:tryptophan 7-halogenase [Flavobacteriales bacterium]